MKKIISFTFLITLFLLAACSKDDDDREGNNQPSENLAEGRISFDISGNIYGGPATLEEDVTYEIRSNTNGVRWFSINAATHNSNEETENPWAIGFRIHMEDDEVILPGPGEYTLINGYSFGSLEEKTFRTQFIDYRGGNTVRYGADTGEITGTLTITSNDEEIITGSFHFEAFDASGEKKVAITNGKFSALNRY